MTRSQEYWTKARVMVGLGLFLRFYNFAPTSTEEYHAITKNTGKAHERDFPSAYAVLKWFATFRQAWTAIGVTVDRAHEPWTEAEDWYLSEATGIIARAQIARDLMRPEGAVKRRLYDLGIDARTRWGWTINRACEHLQISTHVLTAHADRGDLPYFRGNQFIYIDPADLIGLSGIDWRKATKALREAARASLIERARLIMAGVDWRAKRIYQPHPKARKMYNTVVVKPGAMPYNLKRGDVVEVDSPCEGHELQVGRRGVVRRVFFRTRGKSRVWAASIEFKKMRRHGNGLPRVVYSLPLESVKRVRRRPSDARLPEMASSRSRLLSVSDTRARKAGLKLKRASEMRKKRLEAEGRRAVNRQARRQGAAIYQGPYRGRAAA